MLSKIGLGPGAPRRGPFSSPNRFQIKKTPSFLRHFFRFLSEYNLRKCAASGTEWSETTREKFGKCLCLFGIFQVPLHKRPGSRSFVNRGVFSGDFFIIMAQRVGVVILVGFCSSYPCSRFNSSCISRGLSSTTNRFITASFCHFVGYILHINPYYSTISRRTLQATPHETLNFTHEIVGMGGNGGYNRAIAPTPHSCRERRPRRPARLPPAAVSGNYQALSLAKGGKHGGPAFHPDSPSFHPAFPAKSPPLRYTETNTGGYTPPNHKGECSYEKHEIGSSPQTGRRGGHPCLYAGCRADRLQHHHQAGGPAAHCRQ